MSVILNNKEDFKVLYGQMYGPLVNFCHSKTKDWELSQEIVQNTFVKLWMNRNKINITTSLKSYLYSMVRNGIIDHYRKLDKIVDVKSDVIYSIPEQYDSEDGGLDFELAYLIRRALDTMKEKRKKIFELSRYEGLTYKEIANYLDISERAVEDNISKAFVQIRDYLKKNNI